ncbi:MAG: insulinase family protein [Candidatus Aminicenantes bacterium]|nr:insulinase family protein [Candidatus Aminicenantes bacterium]
MSRRLSFIFCMSSLLFFGGILLSAQEDESPLFEVTTFQLENGLQVILSEDYSLPLVSVVLAYNVGSINEPPKKTGLAYMLENLMFQGSRNIGSMQHIHFISKIGGILNAVTTEDRTIFYQTVPASQLALVLWLESDRMISLDIHPSKVKRTRDSLIEEIKHRKLDDPYFESSVLFDQLLYPNKAYSHPVIGSETDLREMTTENVQDFYTKYYIPNNAVLCIIGNFEKRKAIQLVRKYFTTIRPGKPVPFFPAEEHLRSEEIVRNVENYLAPSPGFRLGYRISSPDSPDNYTLTIIEYILLHGKSSRLQKRMIYEDRFASHLSGGIELKKNLATFKFFVKNNTETLRGRSQKSIFDEIDKLKSAFISENELNKAKNMFKRDYLDQFTILADKGIFLVKFHLSRKKNSNSLEELKKYLAVTPSDIIGIVNRYFTEERVVLNIKIK